MPIKPVYEWDQTHEHITLHVHIKGFKKEAVDVLFTDSFIKVNAAPTYLLNVDLLHEIDPQEGRHYFDAETQGLLHLRVKKTQIGQVWERLTINDETPGSKPTLSKKEVLERRKASLQRVEQRYNEMLQARKQQREAEGRRMTAAQWDVDKSQRRTIEQRMAAEKSAAEAELYAWEQGLQPAGTTNAAAAAVASSSPSPSEEGTVKKAVPSTPADYMTMFQNASPQEEANNGDGGASPLLASSPETATPGVRQADTVRIAIDFTPKSLTMPTRSRGDEEYYRQSRYKPVNVQDSPMFWKEKGDTYYKNREFKAAADAYSESIKRDGVFMTCVMNRAACYLQLMEYKRCVEDSTLALDLLANTPSSELSQDRYRFLMSKIHARRGAAYVWNDDLLRGLQDYRMAAAYADPELDPQTPKDLAVIEQLVKDRGLNVEDAAGALNPFAAEMQAATAAFYKGQYAESEELYAKILEHDPYHAHARSNRVVVLLVRGEFDAALEECHQIIRQCEEVAQALQSTDGLDGVDSDDEDEVEADEDDEERKNRDDLILKRRAAAKRIQESSGHVYLLLKAYVRGAAALCGKKDYRQAHMYLQSAMRITPYDNDLAEDCLRLEEKIRMDTLISASTGGMAKQQPSEPERSQQSPEAAGSSSEAEAASASTKQATTTPTAAATAATAAAAAANETTAAAAAE